MYNNNVIKLNYRLMQDTGRHISINTLTVLPSKCVLHHKKRDIKSNTATKQWITPNIQAPLSLVCCCHGHTNQWWKLSLAFVFISTGL